MLPIYGNNKKIKGLDYDGTNKKNISDETASYQQVGIINSLDSDVETGRTIRRSSRKKDIVEKEKSVEQVQKWKINDKHAIYICPNVLSKGDKLCNFGLCNDCFLKNNK